MSEKSPKDGIGKPGAVPPPLRPNKRQDATKSLLSTLASEVFDASNPVLSSPDSLTDLDGLTMLTGGEAVLPPSPPEPPPLPSLEDDEPEKMEAITPETRKIAPEKADRKKKPLFKKKPQLGEILISHGVISKDQLDYALAYQKEHARDKMLGEVLMSLQLVKDESYPILINAVMAQLQSDSINLNEAGQFIDFTLSEKFQLAHYEKELFFPLRIVEHRGMRTLDVFIDDEADLFKLDELAAIFSVAKVRPVGKFDKALLKKMINSMERTKAQEIQPDQSDRITVLANPDEDTVDQEALGRARDDNYISRMANKIIFDGVKMGASDIHIEWGEIPRVRYRIDGLLQEGGWISTEDFPALVSRMKIMADLDITERRVPQDGNIRLGIEGMGVIDFRVNTLPVGGGGEKIVLRILDGGKLRDLSLDMIGWPEDMLESYIEVVNSTQGMVLITGPTGSGKSTTLYSSLLYLLDTRGKELNISTAEDPIEYRVEGLNQSQMNEKAGLTFPKILKAMLRQDPDIILVGEIRDLETGGLAVKAAQTGHFVLSTLHTNTAISTISRLVYMGIEDFLVADTVLAIMNQRLGRRICKNCAEEYEPSEKLLRMIPPKERDAFTFIQGAGCQTCNYKGYKGRVGYYEYLRMNRALRRLILNKASEEEILLQAREDGFLTMREFGIEKVRQGVTTLEEVGHHTIDQSF